MGRVEGKVALITGVAAPSGIGRAIAALLIEEGAVAVLTDTDVSRGTATAAELGARAAFLEHDVRSEQSWLRVVSAVKDRFGRLDILVNNAGVTGAETRHTVETITLDEWRRVQAVNVEGVVLGCQAAIGAMKDGGGGAIVNISSMAALIGTPTLPAYGASKAAVRQITQTVAQYCATNRYNIRCNSVHPGIIDTELIAGAFSPEQLAHLRRSVPSGELGRPVDVAQAVLFLASDASQYVTGTRLVVDGGATMQ